MRVLVIGGCGFLGTNLCLYYKRLGAEVVAYDNLAKHEFLRNPYMKPEARFHNKVTLERNGVEVAVADVRDKDALQSWARGCDHVCHTAAQPAMTISWEDPELDFSTNVTGTFNVLETARRLQVPVAICSSIHTYGPDKINSELKEEATRYVRQPAAINEDEPLLQGTVTPLHASKRCNEIYAQSYIDTYGMKVACFRLTGIYGPYQFGGEDHGWVANFAIRTVIGLPVTIFGTGKQLRDILFAEDVCEGFNAFFKKPVSGIYTLGGGEENAISLLESIRVIEDLTGVRSQVLFEPERRGDLRYFVADSSRFTKATGWKPLIRPRQGIEKLLDWVKANRRLFADA
ncbi:MAG: NAD-dependent epimerase/dehydratase family protein [Candidatus Aminicenantales bacterium]